jgi:bifunctional N-acetylglucosamine-1-phosphate-uridyltransferase/glucosamine-1-phosphate-acetyltransferase GlmU-like protein
VAVHPKTIQRLARRTAQDDTALVMPTVTCADPYIHLERDASQRIVRVLHRREGDVMPPVGESDMGLFAMSAQAFTEWLPRYADVVVAGTRTGERNFLPFIAWTDQRARVETFPCEDPIEAVGINTPDDLARVERYLTR